MGYSENISKKIKNNNIRIGIYPDPYLKDKWNNECNQNLKFWANSIKSQGYEVIGLSLEAMMEPDKLLSFDIDVLHLHWPDAIFEKIAHSALSKKIFKKLYCKIAENKVNEWIKKIQYKNIPIVLQVHDLYCHQYNDKLIKNLDKYFRSKIYNISSMILTQEYSNISYIQDEYGYKPTRITYLGDFQEFHGKLIDKKQARTYLGIGMEKKVFLYLGTPRPNRNPSRIIDVFNFLNNDNVILIVAGYGTEQYKDQALFKNIIFISKIIENEDIRNLMCSADYVVNDGINYLTSAVVRCAISYYVPVITYNYGASIDMARDASIFIDGNNGGLRGAIEKAIDMDNHQYLSLVKNAILRNDERTWTQCGIECNKAYKELI